MMPPREVGPEPTCDYCGEFVGLCICTRYPEPDEDEAYDRERDRLLLNESEGDDGPQVD